MKPVHPGMTVCLTGGGTGRVADVLVDARTGEERYLVLSVDGYFGPKRVAPSSAVWHVNEHVYVALTPHEASTLPLFDPQVHGQAAGLRSRTPAASEVPRRAASRRKATATFTRLMVPLDGSELAERALPVAAAVATATGATLDLVHVMEPAAVLTPAGVFAPARVYDDLLAEETTPATHYLESVRRRVSAPGLSVHDALVTGPAAVALLEYERDSDTDLVVLCSHGRTGLARFALGSVADRLLRHGSAPLLLVRAFGAPACLAQAVVPLDGYERAEAALPLLEGLAGTVVQEVTLVRVVATPEERPDAERYLAAIAQRLQLRKVACQCRVEEGDPATVILDTAAPDRLVVMATHGRTGLARWALGSVADRVAHGGAAAVLLVRATEASPAAP